MSSSSFADNSHSKSAAFSRGSKFEIIDVKTGISHFTEELEDVDSVLFYSRTLTETMKLPVDVNAKLDINCFWAIYLEDDKYKPIKNVKYFDFWYDDDALTLDLVFWSNFDGTSSASDYDSTIDSCPSGELNESATRAVYYAKGQLREVNVVRAKKTFLTRMFIFTKPELLLVPGISPGSTADPVIDKLLDQHFLEYK